MKYITYCIKKIKMIRKKFGIESKIWGFVLVGLILVLWEFLSRNNIIYSLYFPPISKILITFLSLLFSKEFISHIFSSILRMIIGFSIAAILAISLGIVMGSWRFIHNLFEPIIEFLRPIPSVAIIPIAILFLGIGNLMKIFVIIYASMWPILINTIDGVRNIEPTLIYTGKVFGLKKYEIIKKIVIPSASPYIVSGLRISSAIALILVITAEMVGGVNGLGYFILYSQRSFRIPEMYAGIITIAIIGYLITKLFIFIENRFMKWHKEYTKQK